MFDIAAMGESALKSHMKSAKNDANVKAAVSNPIKNFWMPSVGESSVNPTSVDLTQSQSSGLDGECKKHELVTDAEILHHYHAFWEAKKKRELEDARQVKRRCIVEEV
ncbi:hypothetical protein HPB47_027717 [Ixodes persulcatus]|uniref:Uncharacterized protein n=1 Tax=Ixodes persulcatus TaxID=34615 RepID=A0AC60PVR4_IXOPE|nr:hypothetical protein HPB47_027717 [Ixodes persulcatus]